jgi:hypothetical protein
VCPRSVRVHVGAIVGLNASSNVLYQVIYADSAPTAAIRIEASILFEYPTPFGEDLPPVDEIVADMCFPDGIGVEQIHDIATDSSFVRQVQPLRVEDAAARNRCARGPGSYCVLPPESSLLQVFCSSHSFAVSSLLLSASRCCLRRRLVEADSVTRSLSPVAWTLRRWTTPVTACASSPAGPPVEASTCSSSSAPSV